MLNKRKLQFGDKNEYLKKINSVSNDNSPCGIRTRDVRITCPTLYPLDYGLSYMPPSIIILLIKRNVVSIRGQPFRDDVLSHLKSLNQWLCFRLPLRLLQNNL